MLRILGSWALLIGSIGLLIGSITLLSCTGTTTPVTVPDTLVASDGTTPDTPETSDVEADVSSDASIDTQPDAPIDTQADAPVDTQPDAPVDTQPDVVPDTLVPDTLVDATPDATSDTNAGDTEPPDASDDVWQGPAFPKEATSLTLASPITAQITVLRDQEATVVAALQGGRILVQDTEGTHLYDTTWDPVIPEFEGAITPLLETADWGEDTLMVCEDALRVLHKGFAFSSPLQDLLAGQSIHTAVAAGSGDTASLWLGTDVALYRWEGDNLAQVQPTGLPTANALLAEGGSYDGNPALWLAAEGWLVAILPASEGLQSVPVLNNLAVTDLSVDSGQWLWLVSEGDIVRRHPEGEWEWLAFPEPVQAVHGRADSPTTWFVLETSLVVHEDGAYRLVEGVTPPTDADITEAGDLLIADATGVARVMLDAVAPEVIAWNSHIAPIYEKECALCHSPDNIAEDFSAMQTWIDSIALIMTRVQTDMPANDPPLDPASVSLIQQWIDGGFSP